MCCYWKINFGVILSIVGYFPRTACHGVFCSFDMHLQIPLSSFSWKEVETWSRLDSPRVLQLYGAVQEGLNVILFMDLKTGTFGVKSL